MTLLHNMHLFQCISTIVGFLASQLNMFFFIGQILQNLDLLTAKILFFKKMHTFLCLAYDNMRIFL